MGAGVRQGLNFEEVKMLKIPVPPIEEQISIAAYLDEKCSKIDEIIASAKASIEDYKQWKTSIIYEAVTKGLDPDAEMKDSGIEWIGKMPLHWKVSRIKNETINEDNLREPISAENRNNQLGLYDYYGASGAIDKIDDYNVDDEVLLIGEDGANLRMRNLPLVYKAKGDYSNYITGSAQPKLSQFNLMRFPIPIAPINEQFKIEKFLNNKCLGIDKIITEKELLIIDLESYKKSLIYEVVTGKRRVC